MKIKFLNPVSAYGAEILNALCEAGFDADKVSTYSTQIEKTRTVSFGDTPLPLRDVADLKLEEGDLLLSDCGGTRGQKIIAEAVTVKAFALDIYGILRTDPDAPVFTTNFSKEAEALFGKSYKARLPNVFAMHLDRLISPLIKKGGEDVRAVVTGLLPASHFGRAAMDELFSQTRMMYMNEKARPQEYQKQIAFNLLPTSGDIMKNGEDEEEWATSVDCKQIFGRKFKTLMQCVSAPVYSTQSLQVNLSFAKDFSAEDARACWSSDGRMQLVESTGQLEYMTPAEASGDETLFISRLRDDSTTENGISFWSVADNLRLKASEAVRFCQMCDGRALSA
tara:strand:+ start:12055 stop:13065 length:1011 start_codon:yes stop_codon:yes gene_type:complete